MTETNRRLPVGYYLLNFETVLREVRLRYEDLLHAEELRQLEAFLALPLDARRLYVRMLARKGPWFREDELDYGEIRNVGEVIRTLCSTGFCADRATLQELLPLLVKEELAACLRRFGVSERKGSRREAMLQALLSAASPSDLEQDLHPRLRPVRPLQAELWSLVCFLFFGNGEQDLSSFVLADLGRIRYEAYALDPAHRLFQSRCDLDFLLSLGAMKRVFEKAVTEADLGALGALTEVLLTMAPHPGVRQQRRYHRFLNEVGRAWERNADCERALACYARSQLPPARERITRITGDVRLAIQMAEAPLDASEERFARVFLHRHGRRLPEAEAWLREHPATEQLQELHLTVPRGESVERAALEAARAFGWEGFFAENSLWQALFGLVFWEELFAPVPGAFQHRFQSAPLDIGHPDFFVRRQAAFEQRLEALQDRDALAARVLGTADAKWGIANVFLPWHQLSRELLEAALAHVPPSVLGSVLRTMAQSPRAFSSGFPDLFLFRPQRPDWALWEVKGPGDSLRPEQERWLRQFHSLGCEVRVAKVKWS